MVGGVVAVGSAAVTAATDVVLIFRHLQDAETGDFVITGLLDVHWLTVGIVTAVGAAAFAVLTLCARRKNNA